MGGRHSLQCVLSDESSRRLVREEQLPFPLRQVTDLRGNGVLWGEANLETTLPLLYNKPLELISPV